MALTYHHIITHIYYSVLRAMESFLRTRVDLQQMYSSSTMALGVGGDAHYFEDLVTPDKVRQYLNSSSVSAWAS